MDKEFLDELVRVFDSFYPDVLAAQLCQLLGGGVAEARVRLDGLAAEGRLLLLFDGLDEVPSEQGGPGGAVDRLLGAVADLWATTPIVVTSRPLGGHSPGPEFRELELLPFAEGDRFELLARWLGGEGKRDDEGASRALTRLKSDSTASWVLTTARAWIGAIGTAPFAKPWRRTSCAP